MNTEKLQKTTKEDVEKLLKKLGYSGTKEQLIEDLGYGGESLLKRWVELQKNGGEVEISLAHIQEDTQLCI